MYAHFSGVKVFVKSIVKRLPDFQKLLPPEIVADRQQFALFKCCHVATFGLHQRRLYEKESPVCCPMGNYLKCCLEATIFEYWNFKQLLRAYFRGSITRTEESGLFIL